MRSTPLIRKGVLPEDQSRSFSNMISLPFLIYKVVLQGLWPSRFRCVYYINVNKAEWPFVGKAYKKKRTDKQSLGNGKVTELKLIKHGEA